ncbi:MAG: hypothetical protein JRN56_00285 [Nitrososphaerota archaeon]|jgi:hypothetical protein|nr:hypothetical protein [Nitrososphaerota archaeon]MDG6903306.1 hypothetical protein [Nitrososphaerota archaeon]MDG6911832.1 hypothetical protein [Nitrososphaerota archaeon]MDG6940686.1 hypothetical protein [Nitrososphaerota archaeon]MDG6960997.1 hypothetical protein [Nitrososphaerota archaeon]
MSKGTASPAVVVFVAILLMTSSVGAYYYYQDQQQIQVNRTYTSELSAALASYRTLSGNFHSSMQDYNTTLSLLAAAVADLNTSTPAYQNASRALATLWNAYQVLSREGGNGVPTYEVNMLVDYGNGTRVWYNDTRAQPGWNGYLVTLVLLNGDVQATWYPQYGEHYVTGIGGVSNTQDKFWFLITANQTGSWQVAQYGADQIHVVNGTTFAWIYCPENAAYGPSCPLP